MTRMHKLFQRKLLHFLVGVSLILLFSYHLPLGLLTGGILVILLFILWQLPRLRRILPGVFLTPFTPLETLLLALSRDEEPLPGWGVITLIMSVSLPFLVLPREAALLVSLYVAIGDALSSMLHGLLHEKKLVSSLLGMLPALITATILTSYVWWYQLTAYILASLLETITPQSWWDDDLSISLGLTLFLLIITFF